MTPHRNYEDGLRIGRTEATLEGIAKSIDRLWDKVDALPCAERRALLAGTRRTQSVQWWLIGVILLAILGLAFEAISRK